MSVSSGAANPRPDEPLGVGGEVLHDWAMNRDDAAGRDVLDRGIAGAGAIICGRRTYDNSIHVVPVLFGAGIRLTETLPAHIRLEPVDHSRRRAPRTSATASSARPDPAAIGTAASGMVANRPCRT